MAPPRASGVEGAGRCAASAHPPAFPVQQHEHDREPDPQRSRPSRAHRRGSRRSLPRPLRDSAKRLRRDARRRARSDAIIYLRIEELRLGDRLQMRWDVGASAARSAAAAPLLQPLVENAIYHGIQPLRRRRHRPHRRAERAGAASKSRSAIRCRADARAGRRQRPRAGKHPRAHRVPFRHTWRAARRTRRRRICGDGAPSRCEP